MPRNIFAPIEGGDRVPLPKEERELLDQILKGYIERRQGALRHTEKTVRAQLGIIYNFLKFVGRAPWECTESDFERWCDNLYDSRKPGKRVAASTQRKYQSAIQQFYQYMVDNMFFSNEIHSRFGIRVKQIVTDENKIPHINPHEKEKERSSFTREEIAVFFDAINCAIKEAKRFSGKDFHPLRRDKVFFFTMYAMGLRIGEGCNLNLDSFRPNPRMPEFGNFGLAIIKGKGSRGSGPKIREIPIIHPSLPGLLEWYIQSVRPCFLKGHNPNECALFLSNQGNRVSGAGMTARFHECIAHANLESRGFVPHCLRHTFTTHMSEMGMSLEFSRLNLGHVYGETTQRYTHLGDEYVRDESERASTFLLNNLLKDKGG